MVDSRKERSSLVLIVLWELEQEAVFASSQHPLEAWFSIPTFCYIGFSTAEEQSLQSVAGSLVCSQINALHDVGDDSHTTPQ